MLSKIISDPYTIINELAQFLLIYIFCMLGSYIHEFFVVYNKRNKKKKINTKKFMITALLVAVAIFSISDYIKLEMKTFAGLCFFVGILSEEITHMFMTLDGWLKIIKYIKAITKGIKEGLDDVNDEEDEDKDKK